MDTNLQRTMLENVDMSSAIHQLQGDISKINNSVLRGIEGGTLHFITVPRSEAQEFIDHSLIAPEYIAAQIQNGLVVDIIPAQNTETTHEQSQPTHIYQTSDGNNGHTTSQQQTLIERQYLQEVTLSTPQTHIQQEIQLQSNTANGNVIIEDPDRRLAAAFLQYVQKEAPQLITNETQVIVSNKEMATLTPLSEAEKQLHVAGSFVTSIDNDHLINQHFLHDNSGIKLFQTTANAITNIPPLPPLTPITKLQSNRRTREMQQIIQYKSSLDLTQFKKRQEPPDDLMDDSDAQTMHNVIREQQQQQQHQQHQQQQQAHQHFVTAAPKKTLPHKKRITKKLKSIHQDDTHLLMGNSTTTTTLSNGSLTQELITGQQQAGTMPQTTIKSDNKQYQNFNNLEENIQRSTTTTSTQILAQYSCEICGLDSHSQLEFFSHLKQHYEPAVLPIKSTQNNCLTNENHNQIDLAHIINGHSRTVINEPFTIIHTTTTEPTLNQSNDDDSVDAFNEKFDTVKCEENEFSDTEDMLEGGVVDKVQNAVDNYIENNSNEVHDIITLGNPQNQINIAIDGEEKDWYQTSTMSNNIVFQTNELTEEKVDTTATLLVNDNSIGSHHSYQHQQHGPNHEHRLLSGRVIEQNDGDEMTVIYEISEINEKTMPQEYTVVDQNGQGLMRRELLKPPMELLSNYQVVVKNEADGPKTKVHDHKLLMNSSPVKKPGQLMVSEYYFTGLINDYPDEDDPEAANDPTLGSNIDESPNNHHKTGPGISPGLEFMSGEQCALSIRDIQDEFIEEEKTDSDSERPNGGGPRKKRKFFRCKRCNKLCNSKNALHYHFLSHTGERPFQCDECGKSFFASSALKVHKRLHSGDKPYTCDVCKRPFRQWGDLRYHIQSRHTAEKIHQCEFCGKDFARRYSLVIHRRIHTGEKNYKCEFCDRQFRASSYLQVHRKIHTGEKPHQCAVCGKKFRVRGDLKRHSAIHERDSKFKEDKINDLSLMGRSDLASSTEASSSNAEIIRTNDTILYINQSSDTATRRKQTANNQITKVNQSSSSNSSAAVTAKSRKRGNNSNQSTSPKTKRRSKKFPIQLIKEEEPLELLHKSTMSNGSSESGPMDMTQMLHLQTHEQILPDTPKETDLDAQQQFINWPIVSYMS